MKKWRCTAAIFRKRTHYFQLNLVHQRPNMESSMEDPRLPKCCTSWIRRIVLFCAHQSNNHGAYAMLDCSYEINFLAVFHKKTGNNDIPLVFQLFRHERFSSFSMINGVIPMLWHFLIFVSQSTWIERYKRDDRNKLASNLLVHIQKVFAGHSALPSPQTFQHLF
jgi:hypothetical protein